MTQIVGGIEKVASIMRDITMASEEQHTGIIQITEAIRQMDSVTQQNAALVEQAAAAADSMQLQAADMAGLVRVFKLKDDEVADIRKIKTIHPAKEAMNLKAIRR
jgi:methyl-accepting chemotaxis protein